MALNFDQEEVYPDREREEKETARAVVTRGARVEAARRLVGVRRGQAGEAASLQITVRARGDTRADTS